MKIAVDGTVFQQPISGIAKGTRCLYENCTQLTQSLDVMVLHKEPLTCTFAPKIRSVQIGRAMPSILWRSLALRVYLASTNPTFVHFPWNGFVPRLLRSTKIIVTLHDVLPLLIPEYFPSKKAEEAYRVRVQADIDRSDLLLTVSKFSKKEILRNFSVQAEPIVVYNAPTIQTTGNQESLSQSQQNYFLYVGGYHKRKGIESLLKVFITLHSQQNLESKLLLVGNPSYYSKELKHLIDEGFRVNAVEERGYVSDSVLANLYANAKALIYPSKFEGFGLPPLEAMASGCPVVTTKCTAIPEICGDAVYYADPDDEETFANSLINLDNDHELREKLTRRGLKQASKFSWDESSRVFWDELLKLVTETQ
jgi:glycosyltransferase involved in cell wall biosynthesis